MHDSWLTSMTGQKLVSLISGRRPAWLWAEDGETLAWCNDAARLYTARIKDGQIKLGAPLRPINGQVKRLMRLGSFDRESKARVPFRAGDKPLNITCRCTPMHLANQLSGLLIVGETKIDKDIYAQRDELAPQTFSLLPQRVPFALLSKGGRLLGGSEAALKALADGLSLEDPSLDRHEIGEGVTLLVIEFDRQAKAQEVVSEPVEPIIPESTPDQVGMDAANERQSDTNELSEPEADTNDADETIEADVELTSTPQVTVQDAEQEIADALEPRRSSLSDLITLIESSSAYFAPLGPEDEVLPDELAAMSEPPSATQFVHAEDDTAFVAKLSTPGSEFDIGFVPLETHDTSLTSFEKDVEGDPTSSDLHSDGAESDVATAPTVQESVDEVAEPEETLAAAAHDDADDGEWPTDHDAESTEPTRLWRLTGRGPLRLLASAVDADVEHTGDTGREDEPLAEPLAEPSDAPEGSEQTSATDDNEEPPVTRPASELDKSARYNFDELSRLLTDRITNGGIDDQSESTEPQQLAALREIGPDLVVLNRLHLGILIFREDHIAFANRTFIDMVGCHSLAELRARGLTSILPQVDRDATNQVPVTRLITNLGETVRVETRLQTLPFQGESSLMLTARRLDAESVDPASTAAASVDLLAKWADARGEGLLSVKRDGMISACTANAVTILGHAEQSIVDRPLSLFVRSEDAEKIRRFLARNSAQVSSDLEYLPLRLANGATGHLYSDPAADEPSFMAFLASAEQPTRQAQPFDAALLHRLSRGVRRPLNTVMGFAQLIESEAFGPVNNDRYRQYAHDIVEAGRDIESQIDELDDFARIEGGQYAPSAQDFDLSALLEDCEILVRQQAAKQQVFVRSAISERLPHVRADRPTMRKAILNMLASAITKSTAGGKVILSATTADDGAIEVHVRDSGDVAQDASDGFAVFREPDGARPEQVIVLKSTMGLALTRSLLAVNSCDLSVGPAAGAGNLMTMRVPRGLIVAPQPISPAD